MDQQNTQKDKTKNQEYEQIQQIEEDDDFFLKRREMFKQAKNNIAWKGTFAQKIGSSNPTNQQPLQMTFLNHYQQVQIPHQKYKEESEFSEFNSSFSSESQKQEEKLNDSSNKTTGTFSLTATENSESPQKITEPSSFNLSSFAMQLNNKEHLKVNNGKQQQSIEKDKNNDSNHRCGTEGFDKSIYLKPGKSIYEVKVQNLGQHIYFKYKNKTLEVCPNNLNFIFEEFLNRNVLLPQIKLEQIPVCYWKGCCELLVIFINNKYGLFFKEIIDSFNKNKIYNKYIGENNGFFDLSLLKAKYSKAQILINAVEQKIACLRLMKDQFSLDIEQQQRKVQNLWIMRSFEKAEEFSNEKIKTNANKKMYKDLRSQMIKDRDWWISNYFHTIDI